MFNFGKDIYTCQTRTTNKRETDPEFELTCEFDVKMSLNDLKKHHLKISLMPLNITPGITPLSVISIDFFTLVFGPTHHAIRMKSNGGRTTLGLLQYNIQFEQICDTIISLKSLDIRLNSIEDNAVCANIRCVAPDAKIDSNWSISKVGRYDTKEHKTMISVSISPILYCHCD